MNSISTVYTVRTARAYFIWMIAFIYDLCFLARLGLCNLVQHLKFLHSSGHSHLLLCPNLHCHLQESQQSENANRRDISETGKKNLFLKNITFYWKCYSSWQSLKESFENFPAIKQQRRFSRRGWAEQRRRPKVAAQVSGANFCNHEKSK